MSSSATRDVSHASGCFLTDIEGRITSISPDGLDFLDRPVGEVVGRFVTDFLAPTDLGLFAESYRSAIAGSPPLPCTLSFSTPSGEHLEVQTRLFLVHDGAGRPRSISLLIQPLPQGDHVQPQARMADPPATDGTMEGSDALMRALMTTRALGFSVTDPDGTLVQVNGLASEIMGVDTGVGVSISSDQWTVCSVDGTLLEPSRYPAAIALREGRTVTGQEIGIQRPDGDWRWLSVNSAPVDHEDYGVVIAYTDITASKEGEARLQATLAAVPDLIFSLDRGRHYVVLQGGGDSPFLHGQSPADYSGRPRRESTGADPVHRSAEDRAFAGEHVTYEWKYDRLDPPRWVQTRLSPIPDASGEIQNVVGVTRDITDRVALEEARLEMELRSVEAQKAESLAVLAGGVAHDFNNLLSGVLLNAELARRDLSPTAHIRELLDDIVTSAERATELSRQMLAYSGRGALHRARIQPNEVLRSLQSALGSSLHRDVVLSLDLADGLPEVEGDQSQLWQAIYNVTSNAIEAVAAGGHIRVSTDTLTFDPGSTRYRGHAEHIEPGEYIAIRIADDGPGVSPEVEDRIFEPFFSTNFQGRGLGLSAAQGIMQAHGGAILYESGPVDGTTFHLLLPPAEASQAVAVPVEDPAASLPLRRPTILFADDEHIVRRAGARLLNALDYDVIEAEDGEDALRLWEEHSDIIDLVILDVVMPKLGGRETMVQLRERSPGLKIILTSGYDAVDILAAPGPTPDGFVEKPFRLDHVRTQVDSVMA